MKLVLLNYNNYINRKVKRKTIVSDYLPYQVGDVITVQSFNTNDGVDTQVTLNIPEDTKADYLLAYTENDIGVKYVHSRWFIMDMTRTRGGQSVLRLHRDVIVDNYNNVINSPAFIKRATLSNNDPYIFNDEGLQFNQKKSGEFALKDKTQVPWIVGYIANDLQTYTQFDFTRQDFSYDYSAASWDDFAWKAYVTYPGHTASNFKGYPNVLSVRTKLNIQTGVSNRIYMTSSLPGVSWSKVSETINPKLKLTTAGINNPTEVGKDLSSAYINADVYDDIVTQFNYESKSRTNLFKAFDGKIIRIGPAGSYQFYKLRLNRTSQVDTGAITSGTSFNNLLAAAKTVDGIEEDVFNGDTFFKDFLYDTYTLTAVTLSSATARINFPVNRNILNDAPYTMFAMPYWDITMRHAGFNYTCSGDVCQGIANAIATGLGGLTGSTFIYDLQLLPYCPVYLYNSASGYLDLSQGTQDIDWTFIKTQDGATILGVCFFPTESSFTVSINNPINTSTVINPATERKLSNQLDLYRLCSPNYQGSFDFSLAKNNGFSSYIAKCTYRPYSPYIKIAPEWDNADGIYGGSSDDARGLICGGDFSLPVMSDKLTNYEIQNKNYLNIFDRQTQTLDMKNKYSLISDIAGAASGIVGGVAGGAMMGGVGGAVAGGVLSAAGGVADVLMNENMRKEEMSARADIFNMQIGNIQALPQSIAKVGAQTANYRYFPIIEYYTCTDAEKNAFKETLKWRGMTVNRPGTISEFINDDSKYTDGIQFISADLLDLSAVDDSHMLSNIKTEISNGVYFVKE